MTDKKVTVDVLHANLKGMIRYFLINSPNRIVRSRANIVSLEIGIDDEKVEGYTDGSLVHAKSSIKFIPGLTFHELGHLLYTWFRGSELLYNSLKDGKGIPEELIPKTANKALIDNVNKELIDDKHFAIFFGRSVLKFSNIVEDAYLERTLLSLYKVLFAKSLVSLRHYMWETDIPTVKEIQEKIDSKETTELLGLWALFLMYGKYGKVKRDNDSELSLPIMDKFRSFSDSFLTLVKDSRKIDRFKNTIYFAIENLYELIKEEYEEVKEAQKNSESPPESTGDSSEDDSDGEGESEGKSGDGDEDSKEESSETGKGKSKKGIPGLTPQPTGKSPFEDIDVDAVNESDKERRDPGFEDEDYKTEKPEITSKEGGRLNNDVEGEAKPSASSSKGNEDEIDEAEKDMDDFIKRIQNLADAEQKRREEEALEAKSTITDEKISKEILKTSDAHKGMDAKIIDVKSNPDAYENIFSTVSNYVNDASRKLKKLFESLDRNYTKRGLWYGGRLNFRTAYRPDLGYYQRDISNDPKADLALFVLVDESGSMSWNNRIAAAARATVLLEAVARNINVPCAIYGHTEYDAVEMIKYRDFDDDDNAKFKLPSLSARYNNRDGFALKFALEKLQNRPEERKLLIIISDGQPAAKNYGGREAIKDMQSIIDDYKHTQIIAAAIGSDQEVIEEIYGRKRFLECSDLTNLGEKLVKILQKSSLK